jgi:hypothetical protein
VVLKNQNVHYIAETNEKQLFRKYVLHLQMSKYGITRQDPITYKIKSAIKFQVEHS